MEISNRMHLIIQNGINYGKYNPIPYADLLDLELNINFINSLKFKVDNKQNFQIEVENLMKIVKGLQEKIEKLLEHPDFDPFKEKLRSKFKRQYESYPLEFNGKTYYLYPKTSNFPVDQEISSANGFMQTIQAHIHENKPLKYNYKEYSD